jgi:hypothetical protein
MIAGLLYAFLLYYRDKKNNQRSKLITSILPIFRFTSVTLITLLLLDVFIKNSTTEVEKPIIIIAQDNSSSIIANKDSSEIKNKYLPDLIKFTEALKEKYTVKLYQFDTESKPTETFDFKGKETDISKVFADIENNYANSNVGAIVLASDGIYNKGKNPLHTQSKLNAPIYTIAFGDTIEQKDVWIQAINQNQIAYLGNTFPIEIIVNASGLKNKSVNLSISQNGLVIKNEKISIQSENFSKPFNYSIEATKTGLQKYTVTLSDLTEDKNKTNNVHSFFVDVIDNRDKILIVANAPHPDIAAIHESISATQTYEVDIILINELATSIKPYSLIILHQVNAIPPKILEELKANKKSIFYIGLNPPPTLFNFSIPLANNKLNDAEAILNKDFTLFDLSRELKNGINEWPAIKCNFGSFNLSNGTYALMNQRIGVVNTETPLFVFNEKDGGKRAGFFGDGLWRWKLRDYLDHESHQLFNELIHKTVQYLSTKADKSFFRVNSKKIIYENESIDFTAELYNQSYELISESDITLVLTNEKNNRYNFTFSKKQNNYQLTAGQFPSGEYTYEANAKVGDKVYKKTGNIIIKEIISEKINTLANHSLLYQLSKESGGKLVYKNELDQLQGSILKNDSIKSISYLQKQITDLINLKWIFALIIALLTTEWYIRKQQGGI